MSRAAADGVVDDWIFPGTFSRKDEDDVEMVVVEGEGEGGAEEEEVLVAAAEVGSVEGKRDLGVVCDVVVAVEEGSAPLKWGRKFGGLVKVCFDSMDIIGLGFIQWFKCLSMTPQNRHFISVLVMATIPLSTFIVTSSPSSLSPTPARARNSGNRFWQRKKIGRGERHQNFALSNLSWSQTAGIMYVKRWVAGLLGFGFENSISRHFDL